MEQNGFAGKHIMMDCQVKDSKVSKLSDIENVYKFFTKTTELLGMTLISPPLIVEFPFSNEMHRFVDNLLKEGVKSKYLDFAVHEFERKNKEEGGVSGLALWAESHQSFHSWTEQNYFSIDCFSCKNFDHQATINFIKDYFIVSSASISIVKRYTNKPHEIETAVI